MGSAAVGFTPNKNKYQSNEYTKELGLNWMDFHNRQYDPQTGRFLSIDPMAAVTANVSPYAAMDNNPVSVTDPLGLTPNYLADNIDLFKPDIPYESVVMQNQKRSNAPGNLDYSAEDAEFEAYSRTRSESEEETTGESGASSSTTQGDASASNSSSSEVCTNDENSSASASDVADGDDGKKGNTPGPFTDVEDPGREVPKGESPQESDNPLLNSHGEEVYSIEQFVEYNKGRTFEEIIHQRGGPKDKLAGGPKLRYVRHPNDGYIMDMRHVLVVGYQVGNVGGFGVEVAQAFSKKTRPSSFDKQDFYSNAIGARFFDYIMSPNISKDFTTNFYNFIIRTNGKGASGSW